MLELYIANKNYSSWSLRPWVLMRELEIPFVERLVPFGDNMEANAFSSFSPSGKVPCLIDGAAAVWDSLAITEYLAEQAPQVWPADASARAWARSAVAEMHSGFQALRECCTMNCGLRVQIGSYSPALKKDLARLDELWLQSLFRFGGPYLAGQSFTAVDAFFAPVAFRVQTYEPVMSEDSLLYAKRLLALPSMQDWYAAALLETWRDEAHEVIARNAGTWLNDYRVSVC
ncbi:MAG: glutathione S-transferase family protein [Methylobacter sp.]|nr:glutathione S-transferase family protein [Methylobacter sp.]